MRLSSVIPEPGPLRVLTVSTLVNTIGGGMFMAVAVIYYTRVLGLPATTAGVALSVAALAALLGAAPLGHLADRIGPRETVIAATTLAGLFMLSLLAVRGFWALLLVLCGWGLAQSASHSWWRCCSPSTAPPSCCSRYAPAAAPTTPPARRARWPAPAS